MALLKKHPNAARLFRFDFGEYEELEAGQTLTSTNLAVAEENGDGALTIGTPVVNGDGVDVMLSGGTASAATSTTAAVVTEYDLKCTVQTNAATTPATKLIGKGKLLVSTDFDEE